MLQTRKEWMPEDRSIESYSDEVITAGTRSGGAVLDCGFLTDVSDPDYSHSGNRSQCAAAIRKNARGEDVRQTRDGEVPKRVSPCLQGYDLHYRLMPHWDRKERLISHGVDPDEMILSARENGYENWDIEADWLTGLQMRRHLEFFLSVLVVEQKDRVDRNEVPEEDAREEIVTAILEEIEAVRRCTLTPAGLENLRTRLDGISFEKSLEISGP